MYTRDKRQRKMPYSNWLKYLKSAEKHLVLNGRNYRCLYLFPDGRSMIEEYSLGGFVERRVWRSRAGNPMTNFNWYVELGEKHRPVGALAEAGGGDADRNPNSYYMVQQLPERSFMDPVVVKSVSKNYIIWNIRNLPYPREVFRVAVDTRRCAIIVKTTNGKFFKHLNMPELRRCGLRPLHNIVELYHSNNILTVAYRKPLVYKHLENEVLQMLGKIRVEKTLNQYLSEGY